MSFGMLELLVVGALCMFAVVAAAVVVLVLVLNRSPKKLRDDGAGRSE